METEEKLKLSDLNQFYGTESYHKHLFGGVFTDGVAYLAEKGKAFWLLDVVFSYARKEPFQLWVLRVKNGVGIVTMQEDCDAPVLVEQEIPYTDFPLEEVTLYLIDGVLLLPSEY